jgi:RHH-type proline utilization regulon transcriptional repressor/proline dehydrogenase/delta 1-pyrroline-5-carboxylate dehydrogenase
MNLANSSGDFDPGLLDREIQAQGLEIFARLSGTRKSIFARLPDKMMEWAMRNEALKVELFRFVDVLPTLHSPREVARHATEYLDHDAAALPKSIRWWVRHATLAPWLVSIAARRGVAQMGRTFILARDGASALPALRRMRRLPLAFSVDILGETAVSELEAGLYQQRYLDLIDSLTREAAQWPAIPQIDSDDRGEIPRVNVSIKLSALYSQIHPADPETAVERISARVRPLLLAAQKSGAFINFDMESSALKDVTLTVFKRILDEPAFQNNAQVGLALQAYLRESAKDLDDLIGWAKARQRRITIRLIKGAYWDYETILSRQRGWPSPVFARKPQTDANYEALAWRMLENPASIRCAFATHNIRSAAACMVFAKLLGVPPAAFEFQMLHGMAEPIKRALASMGYRVRDYCPIGDVLPGMSYLVRRLLENTSNEGFLRATFSEKVPPATLLQNPANLARKETQPNVPKMKPATLPAPFKNEPLTDFTRAENRQSMVAALAAVRAEFGSHYPSVVGGHEIWSGGHTVKSINPADPTEIVGSLIAGNIESADLAIEAAAKAFPHWRRTSVGERAAILERAADVMQRERFTLAAWEIYETGKPWLEADADVAEAIDFCRYYAWEMRRIASHEYAIAGETSLHHYIPRGITAVIAPWNFPLAILCGMTAAALVTGNTVIMKPAEQSSVLGWLLMDVMRRAGVPAGVLNFLPGSGKEVGSHLVWSPQVSTIAFTGSRKVGLEIYEAAGRVGPHQKMLKHAVCEMGGKNAIIIDNDADIDEAIPAILYSAFGYAGQKCSALSRLIVLPDNYERLLERLVEAAREWKVGNPAEPGTLVGPVIDEIAYKRILEYIKVGKNTARLAFQGQPPDGPGYFIPPTIFTHVSPTSPLAQEEIFGPVLSVLKAKDLDEALLWANRTQYALTGGFFSRSPANIRRVSEELEAGNVYINRGITGAMVARHPFGGYNMSGGGTKAGGPDYLQHFLLPRVVTENKMRRGFAPDSGDAGE